MSGINLPAYGWRPRKDQLPLWCYLQDGGKRAIEIAHRRWGKDEIALQRAAQAMFERVGSYWHMLPLANRSRKAIWDAVNPRTGRRRIDDAFPREVFPERRETDMFIRANNGSTWQVLGSDNYAGSLGSPPVGVTFSEWALADPNAFGYIDPILIENNGWAAFITTPRGRQNHAFRMFDAAKKRDGWFWQKISALDSGVFSVQNLADAKQSMVDMHGEDDGEALFDQEYLCSFDSPLIGAFYAKTISQLEEAGRITEDCVYDPNYPVETAWDIGFIDDMAGWFYQCLPGEVRVLDYVSGSGKLIDHWANEVNDRAILYGWRYFDKDPRQAMHWVPWDARPKTLASGGKSLIEIAWNDHQWQLRVCKNLSEGDQIKNTRKLLKRVWFHPRCEKGIDALRNFRREWDDDKKCFRETYFHDWSSHGAKGFHYLSIAANDRAELIPAKKPIPSYIKYKDVAAATFDDLMHYNTSIRHEEHF